MAGFPEVGDVFGRYQITGRLGRGGMGVVFSAVLRGLDRSVALKVLAPELASEAHFRSRFTREATALASLYSPHIIHIYDHGEQDGCLFIATQLVAGGDLWDWLDKNGALPPQQALDVVAQVSWALADAHTAGVIHRDIKPGNVLLHRSGDDELFAYLCDFGIAQRNNEHYTRTVGVIGTLGYMAPERCEGADANELTDVYALGCLLWAALMGSAPYHGTDLQVANRHIRDAIPTYPGEGPVSLTINAIIHRSMAKKPEHRYPSATAMRSDLLEAIQLIASPSPAEGMDLHESADATPIESAKPQPVEPLPPTFKYDYPSAGTPVARPPRRTLSRHRILIVIAIAVVVALTLTAMAVALLGSDLRPQALPKETPSDETSSDETSSVEQTKTASPSSSPQVSESAATDAADPEQALRLSETQAEDELSLAANRGATATQALEGAWVPQVSSKCEGIPVDIGPDWEPDGVPETESVTNQQILAFSYALEQRFDALLVRPTHVGIDSDTASTGSCLGKPVWINLVPLRFADAAGANGWCDEELLPIGECQARFVAGLGGESLTVSRS